jgi:hypothetical protein
MATGTLSPLSRRQFTDDNGDPLALGSLLTYAAGTTTPLATYSDVGLTTANPTTITFNAAGRCAVTGTEVALYLTPGLSYKFVVKNAAGTTIETQDNIGAVPALTVDLDVTGTAGETLTAGQTVYLSDGSGSKTAGRWYLADADFVYASTDPIIGMVPTTIASGASGSIRLEGRVTGLAGFTAGTTYYVSATAGFITATPPNALTARRVGVADSTTSMVLGRSVSVPVEMARADGRLTLTTATPVTTADVSAATTLYYTPFTGTAIALYTGAIWVLRSFAEMSLTAAGGQFPTPSKLYDIFMDYNDGTPQLQAAVWTNDTTRATALVRQDGVWVKTGDTQQRYLGTVYLNGSSQFTHTTRQRLVWNADQRRPASLLVQDTTNTWTYNGAAWRQARATATNQIELVSGLADSAITVTVVASAKNDTGGSAYAAAIGEGSGTTASTTPLAQPRAFADDTHISPLAATATTVPAIGYVNYAWLEYAEVTGTTTFYGDNGGAVVASGLSASWWC